MSTSPLGLWTDRLAYAAAQAGRVAWYAGHGEVMRRMVRAINQRSPEGRREIRRPDKPVVGMRRLLADVVTLMRRDLENVERGLYPLPADGESDPATLIATSRSFFRDVPEVARRHRQGIGTELPPDEPGKRPDYYLQNFHFQTGGWMTEESAKLYDMQVEVLFAGAANAMRRQALVPLADAFAGRDQRKIVFADIACGPGTFIRQIRQAWPRLPVVALDLSEAYLRQARTRLSGMPAIEPVVGKAEALPLRTAALDAASVIFLFHELPPEIRREAAMEMGRIMRPGGMLVFVDSLQTGDEPAYDGLLELFPELFHEPYFDTYLGEDLDGLFGDAGFEVESSTNAFLSKVVRLRRRPD